MRFKPFIIALIISFVILSVLFVLALIYMPTYSLTVAEVVEDEPIDSYTATDADSLSVVLICQSDEQVAPSAYVFMKFDVVQARIFIIEIPVNTWIDTTDSTVMQLYEQSGAAAVATEIGTIFAQEQCYYLCADVSDLTTGFDTLGNVSYSFDADVYTDLCYYPAGMQQISGKHIADLLLAENFYDKSDLVAAVCTLCLDPSQVYRLNTLYELLFACDTNLSLDDLTDRTEAIEYALTNGMTSVCFILQGTTNQDRELALSEVFCAQILQQLE